MSCYRVPTRARKFRLARAHVRPHEALLANSTCKAVLLLYPRVPRRARKFPEGDTTRMRAAPIALGVSCTALALLLSLRGEEPVPPRVVHERHQYHQPVPPVSHAATLPARLPDNPASRDDDEAPLPAACVPGRLCATPQRPYTTGGAGAEEASACA